MWKNGTRGSDTYVAVVKCWVMWIPRYSKRPLAKRFTGRGLDLDCLPKIRELESNGAARILLRDRSGAK
ncbi:hypothetical protein E2C01_088884 [Portunus trituberculatus]|uniref:Uncharacterized protein n=1 Tax=Portunus trituberculatus TaxID=210409 RepID=A0A5B7JN32_PORTR|nr:hypothetical protein [Portunus trituberculatus]